MNMKNLLLLGALLFLGLAPEAAGAGRVDDINTNMKAVPISSNISAVEQKVRNAAVRVMTSKGGYGSGTLIKYKGLTLVLTANHVADDYLGSTFYVLNEEFESAAVLIYVDSAHDISILYLLEENINATPIKYSPRKNIIEMGEEVTYSGFPSSHQIMTFRGRVAGYESLQKSGSQILLHTHGWFGCSGSGVYDSKGNIVGILWGVDAESTPYPQIISNLVWVQPIRALNIDSALHMLCLAIDKKPRACK
jgi:S1-C subfamily serine protease